MKKMDWETITKLKAGPDLDKLVAEFMGVEPESKTVLTNDGGFTNRFVLNEWNDLSKQWANDWLDHQKSIGSYVLYSWVEILAHPKYSTDLLSAMFDGSDLSSSTEIGTSLTTGRSENMTAKEIVTQWIMDHMDGDSYTIKQIGHETKSNPAMVRLTIRQLVNDKKIAAGKRGGGRNTQWAFSMPNGDLPELGNMSPYPDYYSTEEKVLSAICRYQLEKDGKTPTIREIMAIADIKSTSTVNYHLIKLTKRGLLTQVGVGNSRMAQVTGCMFQIPNQILERRTIETYDYFVVDEIAAANDIEEKLQKPSIYGQDFQSTAELLVLATPENSAFVGSDANLKMIANALGMGVFDYDELD